MEPHASFTHANQQRASETNVYSKLEVITGDQGLGLLDEQIL